MAPQLDPGVSWVADAIDYEPLAATMRGAIKQEGQDAAALRFWCAAAGDALQ
jgi:hypothetical protein